MGGRAGMGTRREWEGGLSASAQKRINSTRSNGLTAKRAHPGAAPRGRDGAGEGREKGRGVGRRGREDGRGEGQEEWARWGRRKRDKEIKSRKGQRESGSEGGQDCLRGGVSNILPPLVSGSKEPVPEPPDPRCRPPPASTLPLSRQGAARPCAVPADLLTNSPGL